MQLEWLNFGIADESRANSKLGLLGPSDSLDDIRMACGQGQISVINM